MDNSSSDIRSVLNAIIKSQAYTARVLTGFYLEPEQVTGVHPALESDYLSLPSCLGRFQGVPVFPASILREAAGRELTGENSAESNGVRFRYVQMDAVD